MLTMYLIIPSPVGWCGLTVAGRPDLVLLQIFKRLNWTFRLFYTNLNLFGTTI